ncbi:gustatory and odorant receptor 22 [Hyposmocoma kahamanoa]|uniref:gustatory and odorant receptor 22 n=1 Tax=Hyposmocoma kahamanoa TaxID=1477025 RepID=UPI000E6D6A0E|nr:gustatory and odorant receptor 22 [Hyposmocoma kahamanoa]
MNKEKFRMYNPNQNEEIRKRDMFGKEDRKEWDEQQIKDMYGPKITDKDGKLLDDHDSFYKTTKSLLVLFQIMGVMPIMRVPRNARTTKRTTFNWISKATCWAYIIWGLESIIVVRVGRERLENFQKSSNKRFDEVIYNIIFLSILIPHFLLPVASWRHGPQVAIFKNMWTHYQLKYLKITGTHIVFPNLYPLTWGLCFFSWGLSFAVILSQHYLQDDFELWHSIAYYHIIAMLDGFCSLWYINCNAFGTASKGLAQNLHKALEADHPALKLAQYRHLWVDLSHMMQQLGRAYSNMYGIYCMVIFFTTVISLYGALSEILERGLSYKEMGLFVIVTYCMTLLFIICNEAYHASRKVGHEFQIRLLNVNLGAVDRSTQREVEMFLVAIAKNPPIMNLDGFTNINRELFTANISYMSTYLIVLMQFKLTLLRQGARKTIKAVVKAIFNTTTTLGYDNDDDEDEE